MKTSQVLVRSITKAVLNAATLGIAGEIFEATDAIARAAWEDWSKRTSQSQRQQELEQAAGSTDSEWAATVADVISEHSDMSAQECEELQSYLSQIPAKIRRTLSGLNSASGNLLQNPDDMAAVLPKSVSRFHAGDRPFQNVDLELVELLGVGGFGEVWKAKNPHLQSAEPVALKFCLDPDAADTLKRESQVLDRVVSHGTHPGIVRLLRTYLQADPPCLEYEYVDGGSLHEMLRSWQINEGPISPAKAEKVILQLAQSVAFAHRHGMVHRDLKPANVLVTFDGPHWKLKIADFGIGGASGVLAAKREQRHSQSGTPSLLLGSHSPLYAPPEQIRGDRPDPRNDVYAMGVLWYQMLRGDFSLGAPSGSRWKKSLPAGVDQRRIEVLENCLETDIAHRHQDAGELAERLSRLQSAPAASSPQVGLGESAQAVEKPESPNVQQPTAGLVAGIDLGTTRSAIASVDPTGRPVIIPNSDGEPLTPSIVFFEAADDQPSGMNVVVGGAAEESIVDSPAHVAECFKRDFGGEWHANEVCGLQIPPEVLSAFILEALKNDALTKLSRLTGVVITVPAFFDDVRRRSTQEAGRLAGLNVLDIINEPTAAALAYAYQKHLQNPHSEEQVDTRILVYDLGGGTFDATVLKISGDQFTALATDGDVHLGGHDFDEYLEREIAKRFSLNYPLSDPNDAAQLRLDARQAKHALSKRQSTKITAHYGGRRLTCEITRAEFEQITAELLLQTETTTRRVVSEAYQKERPQSSDSDLQLAWEAIDNIVLVGGSSRMPMVAKMLSSISGRQPDQSLSPDEAVALGAALYAESIAKGKSHRAFHLTNISSHSVGIAGVDPKTKRRSNSILIPRNTPLPAKCQRRYTTLDANQRSIVAPVYEGESQDTADCIHVGDCRVVNLPPGLPQGSVIQVSLRYETNGRLTVRAHLPAQDVSAEVELQPGVIRELGDLSLWKRRIRSKLL